jgi:hypothetical protein
MSQKNSKRSTSKAGNQKVCYFNRKEVPKINPNNQMVPLRSIINNNSLNAIKKSFKEDTPQIVTYTLEEYFKLCDSFEHKPAELRSITMRVYLFKIKYIEEPSAEKIYQHFHDTRDSFRDVYNLIYNIPLIQVPLYINHLHLAFIAKWRMDIAK